MSESTLTKIANVLDSVATYIEARDATEITEKRVEAEKQASALATKLSEATGELVDETTVQKLAGLDPAVQGLLQKLSGTSTIDPMGGPDEEQTVKTADAKRASAGDQFLDWILS